MENTNTNTNLRKKSIWYKEPWVWGLIAGPAIVIIAAIFTIYLAVKSDDGLVTDDYYKEGLEVNQNVEKSKKAQQLQLAADVMISNNNGEIRIFFHSSSDYIAPKNLNLAIVHPTRKGRDQAISLSLDDASGMYIGKMQSMNLASQKRWKILLEDSDKTWKLQGIWDAETEAIGAVKLQG